MTDRGELQAQLQSVKATIDKLDVEYEKGMIDIGRYTKLMTEYNIRKGKLEQELDGLAHIRAAEYFDREWDEEDAEQEDRKQREDRKHYRRLLDQYRHILRTVEDQMSKLGTGDAAWVTLRNQERECHQKIKKLELKLYGGYYFDIDDDQRAGWREQLAVQRKNLRRLELQLAKYGSLNAPLSLLNQVDDVKAEIERLERLLKTK